MDRSRTVSGGHSDHAPLISSAEPPNVDSGHVATQHIDDTSYSPPMVLSPEIMESKGGIYASIGSPSSSFDSESGTHHHHRVKRFDHHEARKTLLKTGAMKLLVTLFFSAGMCITLKSWEGFRGPLVLSKIDVRIFNALTIGISLCLGLNILSSLKHYASVFRWSFLTRHYVSLEVFDLILHLSSLAKVTKLMILSSPGFRGKKWLRKFRWFKDVRDDGTKWMWLACLAWLSVNIGSQILVALLSLFWPIENSEVPLLSYGNVTVANLNAWYIDDPPREIFSENDLINETSLEAAWMYGMEAMAYPSFNLTDNMEDMVTDLSGLPGTPIYSGNSAWHYRFFNREPTHQWLNYIASSRNITARAKCEQLELLDGEVHDVGDDPLYLMAREQGTADYVRYNVTQKAGGSVTWMASVPENCGPRCTNFTVMQLPDYERVHNASLFLCNNTLGNVTSAHAANDIVPRDPTDFAAVWGSDTFARIAAGAIGWTGIPWNLWYDRQTRSYSQGSKWSPAHNIAKEEVEDLLMRFTIGAIAAFDDHGLRYNLTHQTVVPSQGQQLDVDWSYIFSILGGICFIQFLALCLLGLFANRTIVRDESFFSMAMLLNPVVSRIGGEAAMVMSGDEIKESRALRFKKIKYDYHEGGKGEPNRVAIFFEGQDRRESRRSWAAGSYS